MLLDKERRGIPYQSNGTGPRWTKEPQWRRLPGQAAETDAAATAASTESADQPRYVVRLKAKFNATKTL